MKIDARHVRFVAPLPAPGRKRLLFVGRANTVQLQETALVIEGHVKKLSFPIVDRFFQTVLSQRTTVTIPYSRIVRWKYSPLYVARTLAALVAWGPVLFCLAIWFKPKVDPEGPLVVAGMLAVLGLLETWLIIGRLLAPRNRVLFRRADGGLTMIAFRVRTRRRQRAFAGLLESNRRTAAAGAAVRSPGPAGDRGGQGKGLPGGCAGGE
jgi:hypothetical protein